MSLNVNWVRTLRTVVIAGLVIALLGAVLGSIGAKESAWNWACDQGVRGALPAHDASRPAPG
jgi:hypothetical protein